MTQNSENQKVSRSDSAAVALSSAAQPVRVNEYQRIYERCMKETESSHEWRTISE